MSENTDTKINMYKGDNFDRLYKFKKKSDGTNFPLTGAKIILTVKRGYGLSEEFQLKNEAAGGSSSEIEDVDLANGQFRIHIVPANTASMIPKGYVYDIEINLAGKIKTYVKNSFKLEGDITD